MENRSPKNMITLSHRKGNWSHPRKTYNYMRQVSIFLFLIPYFVNLGNASYKLIAASLNGCWSK